MLPPFVSVHIWVWGPEYVITSLLEIAFQENETRRPPSVGVPSTYPTFSHLLIVNKTYLSLSLLCAATRIVCLEGALARPCTISADTHTNRHPEEEEEVGGRERERATIHVWTWTLCHTPVSLPQTPRCHTPVSPTDTAHAPKIHTHQVQ